MKSFLKITALFCLLIITLTAQSQSLDFDGIDDLVVIQPSKSLDINSNKMTLEVWIRLSVRPEDMPQKYAGIYGTPDDCYDLYIDKGAQELRFKIKDNQGNAERPGIPFSYIQAGIWYHVAATYNGEAGEAKIYLNGVLMDTHTNPALTHPVHTGQQAAFGGEIGTNWFFKGQIDECRIWNVARSARQINDNMLNELCTADPNLVAYWNFNAGHPAGHNPDLQQLEDQTTNGNTGTLKGFSQKGPSSNWVAGKPLLDCKDR